MLHVDDPADGDYTFPDGDPPVDAEGEIVLEPFRYAVSDSAPGGQQAGARGDELPESGGIPPTVVLASGAAMVLGGLGMFVLLRRASATGG